MLIIASNIPLEMASVQKCSVTYKDWFLQESSYTCGDSKNMD